MVSTKPYTRSDRVSRRILEELAQILARRVNDPRIQEAVVTSVKVTRDLKLARIYYRVPGGQETRDEAAKGFSQARGFITRQLASKLGLRYMPQLEFYFDDLLDTAERVNGLLRQVAELSRETNLEPEPADADPMDQEPKD